LKKSDGALPGELGRRHIKARRGVVVKAMLGAGVLVHRKSHASAFEGRFVGGPSGVDPLVDAGQMNQHWRLDFARVCRRWNVAIKRH